MGEWIQLVVAGVATASAVAIAVWSGRGESASLKRLKAMNDIITGLPEEAQETRSFIQARDALVARVSARMERPPLWVNRLRWAGWTITALGAAAAVMYLTALAQMPDDASLDQEIRGWLLTAVTVAGALVVVVSAYRRGASPPSQKTETNSDH